MIALILEDIREWRTSQMSRTLTLSCLVVLAAGAITLLQPVFMMTAATLVSVLLGWSRGSRYHVSGGARRPLIACPVPALAASAAKAASSAAIWLLHVFVLSPVLVLTVAARGLRLDALAACACTWLVAYGVALGLSFLASLAFAKSDSVAGLVLIAAWLGSSAIAPAIAGANPFVQAWNILKGEATAADWYWIGASAAFAAALFGGAALTLSRLRKRYHA